MYIPGRRHPQSLRLRISLTANAFDRLKDYIFAKNYLQSSKTVDLLRGYTYTLIPYLYTLILNFNPDFFELMITLIPTLILTTMALMKEEWAAIASKYGYRINADKALKDELVEFVQSMIYETRNLIDNDLWAIFLELFKGFTVESFKKIYTDLRF